MKSNLKIIFTTPVLEFPPAGGPQLRIKNSILALDAICELHLLSQNSIESMGGDKAEIYYTNHSHSFLDLTKSSYPKFKIFKILKRLKCALFRISAEDIYAEYIVKYAKFNGIDIVWFGYGNISFELISKIKRKAPRLKLVCDTDSVWSRFILRELPYVRDERKRREILEKGREKELEEKALVELCDITTAVSSIDADYYKSIAVDRHKIHLFSNAIDASDYADKNYKNNMQRPPAIFLGGTFGNYYSPMDSAARWFLEEVFPLIHKRIPNARLYIVGKNSDIGFKGYRSALVEVTGKVESVLPYLLNSDVAIVPLKFESGTRFKILEAGLARIPIVSTRLGAEGLPVYHDEHILLADSPCEFADEVVKCIEYPEFAKGLTSKCYDLICSRYGLPNLIQEAKIILSNLST